MLIVPVQLPMELSLLTLFLTKCLDATFSTIVGNRADEVAASAWNSIRGRLRSGKVTLPANHHLEQASRESLRDAAMFLIARAWQELTPDANWWKFWQNRWRDKQMSDVQRWLKDLERAVRADDAFATFDHAVTLEQSRLHALIDGNADSLLADYFHQRLLTWVEELDLHGSRPAFFDRWVRQGWQPNQSAETITFYQAYCLFFQDKLKHSSETQTIFSASNQS